MHRYTVKITERGGQPRRLSVIAANWFAALRIGFATMQATGSISVRRA